MSAQTLDRLSGVASTVGAVLSTVATYTPPVVASQAGRITARVLGRTAAGLNVSVEIVGIFNLGSGAFSQTGATVTVTAIAGSAALLASVCAFAISGATIQLNCTGVAAQTIEWLVHLDIMLT